MTHLSGFAGRMRAAVIICLLLASPAVAGNVLAGKVVRIADGDTLTLLVEERQHRVRLVEIDAPERGQPFGSKARQRLAELVHEREVVVRFHEHDQYGRVLGKVFVDGGLVNRQLVEEGLAWAYRRYLEDESYLALEREARDKGRGLWSHPAPVPPWAWRRGVRTPSGGADALPSTPDFDAQFDCDPDKRCQDMRSCAEAEFQLRECNARYIDGDNDGRPCEALCRG